jgi:hypothetical protein
MTVDRRATRRCAQYLTNPAPFRTYKLKALGQANVILGHSEYVTQGGDWGCLVRFPALPPLLMRPNSSTISLVDAGLGIPVRSPARQGFAYQPSSVRRFRLPTTSQSPVCLTHH